MKLIFTLLFITTINVVDAQVAPDFTIADIDGNTHHLYETLDQGNIVVLKFFTNWCPICNNTASEVQALFNGYQANNNPVVFWALDRDPDETNVHATLYRDNNNLTFPVIGEAFPVAQLYGVLYQPEYKIICPDRSYMEEITYTQIDQHVQLCLSQITGLESASNPQVLKVLTNSRGTQILWNAPSDQSAQLVIFDVSGRTITSKTIQGQQSSDVNISAPGVYFFTLIGNGENLYNGKFYLSE